MVALDRRWKWSVVLGAALLSLVWLQPPPVGAQRGRPWHLSWQLHRAPAGFELRVPPGLSRTAAQPVGAGRELVAFTRSNPSVGLSVRFDAPSTPSPVANARAALLAMCESAARRGEACSLIRWAHLSQRPAAYFRLGVPDGSLDLLSTFDASGALWVVSCYYPNANRDPWRARCRRALGSFRFTRSSRP